MNHFKLAGILFLHFFAKSQTADIVKIEFNSLTRGYHKQVILSADTLKVIEKNDRTDEKDKVYSRKLTSREWGKLINSLKDISLTEVSELKSPTANRTFDGARHSSLIITTKNDRTCGHAFDDENPHKKLELLLKTILETAKK